MAQNTIYLAHLNLGATEALLKEHFAEYGEVSQVHLPIDDKTNQPKGYGFITFVDESSAERALQHDGKPFLDQAIVVQIAMDKQSKKASKKNRRKPWGK